MIYFFYGEDKERARLKWRAALVAFRKKCPGGMVFHFSATEFNSSQFEELIFAGGLFGEKRLIVGDNLLENKEAEECVNKNLKDLVASPNTLLFLETKLLSDWVKKIEKAGGKIEEHKLMAKPGVAPFNIFAINDALITRNRKNLWIVYQKALTAGVPEEEIFWKLAWQVKTMLVVGKTQGEPETLKPFVVGKARRGLAKFKLEELENFSRELVTLWHDTRRGLADFDIGLEKLVLSI